MAAVVVLLAVPAGADAHRIAQGKNEGCTAATYRQTARHAYQPWFRPITGRWRLRNLKGCAQNERTLDGMRRIDRRLLGGRHDAVAEYRRVTPYGRWAIPGYIVACESGGSWTAYNSSGAGGPYQLMPEWGRPMPVVTMAQKMAHHRIAHALWNGGAGASNWTCA